MEPIELAIFLIFSWIPSAIDLGAQLYFNRKVIGGMCKKCQFFSEDYLKDLYQID